MLPISDRSRRGILNELNIDVTPKRPKMMMEQYLSFNETPNALPRRGRQTLGILNLDWLLREGRHMAGTQHSPKVPNPPAVRSSLCDYPEPTSDQRDHRPCGNLLKPVDDIPGIMALNHRNAGVVHGGDQPDWETRTDCTDD